MGIPLFQRQAVLRCNLITQRRQPAVGIFRTLSLAALGIHGGCAYTNVSIAPISDQVFHLAAASADAVYLRVESSLAAGVRAGTLFGFGVLPLGSVALANPLDSLKRSAYEELALRNVRALNPESGQEKNRSLLTINLDEFSLTAYDLIAVRRVVCEIGLSGALRVGATELRSPIPNDLQDGPSLSQLKEPPCQEQRDAQGTVVGGRCEWVQSRVSAYVRYPFSRELSNITTRCFMRAVRDLLTRLRFRPDGAEL